MNNEQIILELFHKNNGILEAKQISSLGIDNKVLQQLTEKGLIERIGHGLYLDANLMHDEYVIAQYRCRKGVFSHETALYFHELSDRTPLQLMMNTRARDFYDVYILLTTRSSDINKDELKQAIIKKAGERNSIVYIENYQKYLTDILVSEDVQKSGITIEINTFMQKKSFFPIL